MLAQRKRDLRDYFEQKMDVKLDDLLRPLPARTDADYEVLSDNPAFKKVLARDFERTFVPRFYAEGRRILTK